MYKSHIKKRIYTNNFISCLKAQICTNFINGKKNGIVKGVKYGLLTKLKSAFHMYLSIFVLLLNMLIYFELLSQFMKRLNYTNKIILLS